MVSNTKREATTERYDALYLGNLMTADTQMPMSIISDDVLYLSSGLSTFA